MPVPPGAPVHALQPGLMPPPPHTRNMRNDPSKPAKQFRPIGSGNSCQLPIRNLITHLVVPLVAATRVEITRMRPETPDKRIHRIQSSVPEEPHKQIELARQTILRSQRSARPFP